MGTEQSTSSQALPASPRYLADLSPKARQFDFLIGDWDVSAVRFSEDGKPHEYKAIWQAVHLNDGRMVQDDFRVLGAEGVPISSFVTLRSFSEVTDRWELAGLQALEPSAPMQWSGVFADGQMHLDAVVMLPGGKSIHTRIRFFDIDTQSFAWESSSSFDGGVRWQKTASLTAVRKSVLP